VSDHAQQALTHAEAFAKETGTEDHEEALGSLKSAIEKGRSGDTDGATKEAMEALEKLQKPEDDKGPQQSDKVLQPTPQPEPGAQPMPGAQPEPGTQPQPGIGADSSRTMPDAPRPQDSGGDRPAYPQE
jgi:hypothetical protein